MSNKLLMVTPEDVQRFGRTYVKPSEVLKMLASEGYVFNPPFSSFIAHYDTGSWNEVHISTTQFNSMSEDPMIFSGNSGNEEASLKHTLEIYFGLGEFSRYKFGYNDPRVLLTQEGKIGLVNKVCEELDILALLMPRSKK
jgi:hypothetical protein